MEKIGMIGGISWESTQHYYKIMNTYVKAKIGGLNSIEAIIYSLNFAKLQEPLEIDDWDTITKIIVETAKTVESAGAKFLIMTANAIHKIADKVEENIQIPLLHIVDPTAEALKKVNLKKVGLLGTKVTMEEKFYRERLEKKHGIESIVPESLDRELVHKIIFEELVVGKVLESSEEEFKTIIKKLVDQGAEAVILGCTEISLLVKPEDMHVKLFDTTELHAKAAVDVSLGLKSI